MICFLWPAGMQCEGMVQAVCQVLHLPVSTGSTAELTTSVTDQAAEPSGLPSYACALVCVFPDEP